MFSKHAFKDALTSVDLSDVEIAILKAQYSFPNRTVTAPQIAAAVGYPRFEPINMFYGRLGRRLSAHLGDPPERYRNGTPAWFSYLSEGISSPYGFLWKMYPVLAQALEELRIVVEKDQLLAEEVEPRAGFYEGAVRQVLVNVYERSAEVRRACIAHYGACCSVCEFDFGKTYGYLGEGYIHVHHLIPLSEIGELYRVDPIADLRPVCPNCHAMIHRRLPPVSIEELKAMLRSTEDTS